MSDADAIKVLKFLARHELADSMFIMERDGELLVGENCNDYFYYASADMELVTAENLPVFEKAIEDCKSVWSTGESWAGGLFACRVRGMRPLTMAYVNMPKQLWPLFDAAGPERDKDGSTRLRMQEEWEKKAPPYWRTEHPRT